MRKNDTERRYPCNFCEGFASYLPYDQQFDEHRPDCAARASEIRDEEEKKTCKNDGMTRHQKYYAKNREYFHEYHKRWYAEHRAQVKRNVENWRNKNPHKRREHTLAPYGVTVDLYDELLEIQNNVCAICKQGETAKHKNGNVKNLSVDHCHKTGKIRGLLCASCNKGLRCFNDSLTYLNNALTYLKTDGILGAEDE